MSSRHLFYSADGLVVKGLRGAVSYNTDLKVIEDTRVVYDTTHDSNNVSIISGGGAGHEPAWGGYVGSNMLAAAASGDIFAAPSTKQVLSAIDAVPSKKGTILMVGNYTGTCSTPLSFFQPALMATHRRLPALRTCMREGQCYKRHTLRVHHRW